MKIAVECQSPLLQKSLELFLSKYLCSPKKCDILVRDSECYEDKRCFSISTKENADLVKPFSRSQLILALQKRHKELYGESEKESFSGDELFEEDEGMDFSILERRIEALTYEYQQNILRTVRAFYEK